jgi:UDP-N-acetylmuramoyl-L-alanyl-D-glutamate--2,6-diaminopimelate ligase
MTRIAELLGPEIAAPHGAAAIEVAGITADSRAAKPGMLFAAMPGAKVDGARFVADAVAKGAVAVLADAAAELPALPVPVLRSTDVRRALALVAARFFRRQPDTAVAVTGTSGKTSVAEFTRQIFSTLGHQAASLGTIGVVKPSGAVYGSLTTPDPVSLHGTLAALVEEGITHLAFEASSHGLDQRRLDGVRLAAAAFLNLGRDHLDYHADAEAYLAAKLRLFDTLLEPGRPVVVCADGVRSERAIAVAEARRQQLITTGYRGRDLRLLEVVRDGFAQRLEIEVFGGVREVRLPLIGTYQGENALVAAGLAIACGEAPESAVSAIEALAGVAGRLEIVGGARGGLAVVDYAHKPEALSACLDALRPFAPGRLICVFGCGGDRDKGKRPVMGRIATERADVVIVTDDNPRSEVPAAIRGEILAAAPGAIEIGDRAEAIRHAVGLVGAGDVVVIAGKGHETGQIVGGTTHPFSDQDEVRKALGRIGA